MSDSEAGEGLLDGASFKPAYGCGLAGGAGLRAGVAAMKEARGTAFGGMVLGGAALGAALLTAGVAFTGAGLTGSTLLAGLAVDLPAGFPAMTDFAAFTLPACDLWAATGRALALPVPAAGAFAFTLAFTGADLATALGLALEAARAGAGLVFPGLPGDFLAKALGDFLGEVLADGLVDGLADILGEPLAGRVSGFPIECTLFLSGFLSD